MEMFVIWVWTRHFSWIILTQLCPIGIYYSIWCICASVRPSDRPKKTWKEVVDKGHLI